MIVQAVITFADPGPQLHDNVVEEHTCLCRCSRVLKAAVVHMHPLQSQEGACACMSHAMLALICLLP